MHKRIKGPDCNPYGIKISCKPSPGTITYKQFNITYSYTRSSLIPDICKNYDPIRSEPKSISSEKHGRLYQCNNFENYEGMKDGCLFCANWITLDGKDKGHKSTPENMVAYYVSLYKTDAEKFIRFFQKRRDHKEKKKILEGILECDFTNEEIIKYLDKSWSELVREVGLNSI